MAKTVKVTYNSDTLETVITVYGKPFDTSRIEGKEIADWAYPFMMRKVRWNGFYDEMVEALGGEKEFNLVFDGSEADLNELKEAWEDAPVTVVSEKSSENIVVIEYDENSLTTNITVNGKTFDTSRINGKEIADWVYPFTIRKIKWNGIFEELAMVIGSEEYTIQFSGSNSAMRELMEECPETVSILRNKNIGTSSLSSEEDKEARRRKFYDEHGFFFPDLIERSIYNENVVEDLYKLGLWYREVELDEKKANFQFKKSEFFKKYKECFWEWQGENLNDIARSYYVQGIWHRDFTGWKSKSQRFFRMSYVLETSLGVSNPMAEDDIEFNDKNVLALANMFYYGSRYCSPDYYKALEYYERIEDSLDVYDKSTMAECNEKIGDGYFMSEDYYSAIDHLLESVRLLEYRTDYYFDEIANAEDDDDIEFGTSMLDYVNYNIGRCYYKISRCYSMLDENESEFKYLNLAVENAKEFAPAQDEIGMCYFCGIGTYEDYEEAAHCFYKAAEQDYPDAYYHLGVCYEVGAGVDKDNDRARAIYELGVELGSEECEERLANMNSRSYNKFNNNPLFTKEQLKKGLKMGAKALGAVGSVTGNLMLSGIASGAESLISSIMDEDEI